MLQRQNKHKLLELGGFSLPWISPSLVANTHVGQCVHVMLRNLSHSILNQVLTSRTIVESKIFSHENAHAALLFPGPRPPTARQIPEIFSVRPNPLPILRDDELGRFH